VYGIIGKKFSFSAFVIESTPKVGSKLSLNVGRGVDFISDVLKNRNEGFLDSFPHIVNERNCDGRVIEIPVTQLSYAHHRVE
tara:strand:+ start:10026 stop:10271 length:246 start_codon:yes stop_codon:yes gene_type:complete